MSKKNTATIHVNNYIPYYPIEKNDLDDTLLRNKYQKIKEEKKKILAK